MKGCVRLRQKHLPVARVARENFHFRHHTVATGEGESGYMAEAAMSMESSTREEKEGESGKDAEKCEHGGGCVAAAAAACRTGKKH